MQQFSKDASWSLSLSFDLPSGVKMVNYEITVYTSDCAWASTLNYVYIKLVGTDGESERTALPGSLRIVYGAESRFTLSCHDSLGKLVHLELDKQATMIFPEDSWFPSKVEVKAPEGDIYRFPVYHWITDSKVHFFREGTALRVYDDNHLGLLIREEELKKRKEEYCWYKYLEGMPYIMKVNDLNSLPCEVRFSFTKKMQFKFMALTSHVQSSLGGLINCEKSWPSLDELNRVFESRPSKIAEYVRDHWKEDAFFGYQFLNGINPIMIRRCKALPSNFPVTDDKDFPLGQKKLADEMKKGNIFLCDYKMLDGVETNTINGKKQYLMAPLVLLQKTPDDKLMPIAIQLKQKPGDDNPIFFPKDSEYDWLLAKIFVKSADFNLYQLVVHLLRTHLMAEVFAVSLLRNMPMVHPLYKLLIPHTRYTIHINFLARTKLISDDGVFTLYSASGGNGMSTLMKNSMSYITYSSLCIPDDIAERGLEAVPNFYYRDDGLKLWNIIHKFVKGILGYYYKNDDEVQKDTELQDWVMDIFEHGFFSQTSTGIPQRFTTMDELIKFVTMVIFTGSAQHAAVNSGQYDYGVWMPNTPLTLQLPPPTKKGEATEASMMMTFPDINATVNVMDTLWVLSRRSSDFVPLGKFPENNFTEEAPRKIIQEFQGELEVLSTAIQVRNRKLDLPYTYLDPAEVENSVTI